MEAIVQTINMSQIVIVSMEEFVQTILPQVNDNSYCGCILHFEGDRNRLIEFINSNDKVSIGTESDYKNYNLINTLLQLDKKMIAKDLERVNNNLDHYITNFDFYVFELGQTFTQQQINACVQKKNEIVEIQTVYQIFFDYMTKINKEKLFYLRKNNLFLTEGIGEASDEKNTSILRYLCDENITKELSSFFV